MTMQSVLELGCSCCPLNPSTSPSMLPAEKPVLHSGPRVPLSIKPKAFYFLTLLRDSLLASLLDGVRASGNRDVCVKMTPTHKGQRWGLLSMPIDEEVESLHLRFLATPPSKYLFNAITFPPTNMTIV